MRGIYSDLKLICVGFGAGALFCSPFQPGPWATVCGTA
jgi:hypothetical protein